MTICFRQCNIDDCYNDDDYEIYDVSPEAASKLIGLIKFWKKKDIYDFHLCEDCFEEINEEYPFFEIENDIIVLK